MLPLLVTYRQIYKYSVIDGVHKLKMEQDIGIIHTSYSTENDIIYFIKRSDGK